jgi:hypothetical protein
MWRKRAFDPLEDQIGFMADVDTDTDGPHALGTINSLVLQANRDCRREERERKDKPSTNKLATTRNRSPLPGNHTRSWPDQIRYHTTYHANNFLVKPVYYFPHPTTYSSTSSGFR